MIKAIETVYNGYRFRSRLEARWAVFFDALGIAYTYEPEGFQLESTFYLPDFHLTREDLWIEIKPRMPQTWHDDIRERRYYNDDNIVAIVNLVCLALPKGAEIAERSAALIMGNPWPGEYEIEALIAGRHYDEVLIGYFALGRKELPSVELWIVDDEVGAVCLAPINNDTDFKWPLHDCALLDQAYRAARQARFEHGESPWTDQHKRRRAMISSPG